MNQLTSKIGLASTSSIIVTEAMGLNRLLDAVITLLVSVLSVLAVEGISLLKSYLKSKKKEIDNKSKEE